MVAKHGFDDQVGHLRVPKWARDVNYFCVVAL